MKLLLVAASPNNNNGIEKAGRPAGLRTDGMDPSNAFYCSASCHVEVRVAAQAKVKKLSSFLSCRYEAEQKHIQRNVNGNTSTMTTCRFGLQPNGGLFFRPFATLPSLDCGSKDQLKDLPVLGGEIPTS